MQPWVGFTKHSERRRLDCAGRSQTSSTVKYILGFYRAGSAWCAILLHKPRRAYMYCTSGRKQIMEDRTFIVLLIIPF
jgi:hypothetical protein